MSDIGSDNKVTYSSAPNPELFLESKKLDLNSGAIGKVFGDKSNAPTNISGVIAIALVFIGALVLFVDIKAPMKPDEFWKVINPILTLILGYLFGKRDG